MANQLFTILNNQTLTSPNITENGVYTLYTSTTQNNSNNIPCMRMVVEYHELLPLEVPGGIGLIVESINGTNWFPIAYQFESYRNSDQGTQRIISLQPNMSTFDDGIDSIIYVGDRTVARLSRQQGTVGSSFRVRLIINEQLFGTANAFQSARISIYGELHDNI